MTEITTLLQALNSGDSQAADQVVSLLYDELRRLARSRLRRSGDLTLLDTTALVHESYLRIQQAGKPEFADRKHFLAYAAKAMRTIVIDIVRARQADRRGGDALHVTLDTSISESVSLEDTEILRVHEALDELAAIDARLAQVVEMRYFGGLTVPEVAELLGVSPRTVEGEWTHARAWLRRELASRQE